LILEKGGKILVEKRKSTKKTAPGCITFPAGHVEAGETREDALMREMEEELGIIPENIELVYIGDFECEENQRIFFYACKSYRGDIQKKEAEDLYWMPLSDAHILSHDISRKALEAYLKKSRKGIDK
jgi:mutator protein MutT